MSPARTLVCSLLCFAGLLCYYLFLNSSSSAQRVSPTADEAARAHHHDVHSKVVNSAHNKKVRDSVERREMLSAMREQVKIADADLFAVPGRDAAVPPARRTARSERDANNAIVAAEREQQLREEEQAAKDSGKLDPTDSEMQAIDQSLPAWFVRQYLNCSEKQQQQPHQKQNQTQSSNSTHRYRNSTVAAIELIDGKCLSYTERYAACLWAKQHLSRRLQRTLFSRVAKGYYDPDAAFAGREVVLLRVGKEAKSSSGDWPLDKWLSTCSLILEASQCGRRHVFLHTLEGEEEHVPIVFFNLVRTHPVKELASAFGPRSNHLYTVKNGPYQRGDLAAAHFLRTENEKRKMEQQPRPQQQQQHSRQQRFYYYEFCWLVEGDVRYSGSWDHFFKMSKLLGRLLPDATVVDDENDPIVPTRRFPLSHSGTALQDAFFAQRYPPEKNQTELFLLHAIPPGSTVWTAKNPTGKLFKRKTHNKRLLEGVEHVLLLPLDGKDEYHHQHEDDENRDNSKNETVLATTTSTPSSSFSSSSLSDFDDNTLDSFRGSTFGFNTSAGDAHLLFFSPPIRNDAGYYDHIRGRFFGAEYNFDEYVKYDAAERMKIGVVDRASGKRPQHVVLDDDNKAETKEQPAAAESKKPATSVPPLPEQRRDQHFHHHYHYHPLPLMAPPPNTWHFTRRRHFKGRWFDVFDIARNQKRWLGALMPAFGFSAELADLLYQTNLKGDGHDNLEVDLPAIALLNVKKMVTTAGVFNSQFYFAAKHQDYFVPGTAPLYNSWIAAAQRVASNREKNGGANRNASTSAPLARGQQIYSDNDELAASVYGIGTSQFKGGRCLAGVLFHPVKEPTALRAVEKLKR